MTTLNSSLICYELDTKTVLIYHSLLNQPQQLEFESEEDQSSFLQAISDGYVETGFESADAITLVTDFEARQKITDKKREYLAKTGERVNFLSLMTAENCNLGCSYCIAAMNMDEARKTKSVTMPWGIAKKSLDWYFSLPTSVKEYYVNFSGGEPLVNRPVVVQAIEYIRSLPLDRPTTITINTNATLIDESLAAFFANNRVEIATSLDGVPDASDKVRVTKSGLPASQSIIAGWQTLKNAGCELTGFMATFNDKNIKFLSPDIVDFAKSMGFSWVRISCDVIHLLDYPVDEAVAQIWAVYEYGKTMGIQIEGFWSTPIHNLIYRDRIPDNASFFCGAVSGETVSIHPDGRMSACGFSSGSFGNILSQTPFDWGKHRNFVDEYFPGSREFCKGCSIEGSCAGGCNITREVSLTSKDDSAIHYNCEMYRKLTKRLLIDHFRSNPNELLETSTSYKFGY